MKMITYRLRAEVPIPQAEFDALMELRQDYGEAKAALETTRLAYRQRLNELAFPGHMEILAGIGVETPSYFEVVLLSDGEQYRPVLVIFAADRNPNEKS